MTSTRSIEASPKYKWESGGPSFANFIGNHLLLFTSRDIIWASLSMHNTKIYGDNGSSCRIPLDGVKESVMVPFHKTYKEEEHMRCMIS